MNKMVCFVKAAFKKVSEMKLFLNKASSVKTILLVTLLAASDAAMAAGGLAAGTTALTTVKTWLFGFVGVGATLYLIYMVGMALAERKQWSEVGMAMIYCAVAGGATVGGTWAYEIFQ